MTETPEQAEARRRLNDLQRQREKDARRRRIKASRKMGKAIDRMRYGR